MDRTPNTINATDNSLRIIQEIKSDDGARLSDLARQLELSKSTVHSHLNTLREHGYVEKEGEIYHLGLKFFHLGQHIRNRDERYRLVRQKISELGNDLNQAVDFDVEDHGRIITLFHEVDESTEIGFKEGDYFYMHNTATGKALLAEFTDERVREILDQWGMKQETEYTITERDKLFENLKQTRERGFAICDQEWLEGLRAISASVQLPDGRPFGGLSTAAPTYRLTDDTITDEMGPRLVRAARELEDDIASAL